MSLNKKKKIWIYFEINSPIRREYDLQVENLVQSKINALEILITALLLLWQSV